MGCWRHSRPWDTHCPHCATEEHQRRIEKYHRQEARAREEHQQRIEEYHRQEAWKRKWERMSDEEIREYIRREEERKRQSETVGVLVVLLIILICYGFYRFYIWLTNSSFTLVIFGTSLGTWSYLYLALFIFLGIAAMFCGFYIYNLYSTPPDRRSSVLNGYHLIVIMVVAIGLVLILYLKGH